MRFKILLILVFFYIQSSSQNLIINGGFESSILSNTQSNPNEFYESQAACSGSVLGWLSSHNSPDLNGVSHSGIRCAHIIFKDNGQISEGFFQNINLKAGIQYKLQFYIKSNGYIKFYVDLHTSKLEDEGSCDGNLTIPPAPLNIQPIQTTTNKFNLYFKNYNIDFQVYTLVSIDFIPLVDYKCIQFYTGNAGNGNSGNVYIDDVAITDYCCEETHLWQNISCANISGPPPLVDNQLKNTRVSDVIKAGYNVDPNNAIQGDVIHGHRNKIIFQAGKYISLQPGFHVQEGSPFRANLLGCNNDFWINLRYTIGTNCAISLSANPCGGIGPFEFEWKNTAGTIVSTQDIYVAGLLSNNETFTVKVTDTYNGNVYTESTTIGPCGCLKPETITSTTYTICDKQAACMDLGLPAKSKHQYTWFVNDVNAQNFITNTTGSYTKICIPEGYHNLRNLVLTQTDLNDCGDTSTSQVHFDCCPLPNIITPIHIDICNTNHYQLGSAPLWGFSYQWTANSQQDLDLLSNVLISNPSITLNPNNPLPNFPIHYYLTATNACGDVYNQEYILEGTPQTPLPTSPIIPSYCNNPPLICAPKFYVQSEELELNFVIEDNNIPNQILVKELVVQVYQNGILYKEQIFNNNAGFDNNQQLKLFVNNIDILCNNIIVKLYYRRECDIFLQFGFQWTGVECIY